VPRLHDITDKGQICPCQSAPIAHTNMMKFPKPRQLTINSYPDLEEDQPAILNKLVTTTVKPPAQSKEDEYLEATIKYIKKREKENNTKIKLYNANVGRKLFFAHIAFPPSEEEILCLIDTGASNSIKLLLKS